MYHFCAYQGTVGQTPNTALTALTDTIFTIQNSHIIPQMDMELLAAAALGTTISRARIRTPWMTNVAPLQIRPPHRAASGPTDPNIMDMTWSTFRIRGLEEIIIESTSGLAMGTETHSAGLWLGDGVTNIPRGDLYWIRATGTTTLSTTAWTVVPLVFDDVLGAGEYTVIGFEAFSAGAIFARLIFNNQPWRPGGMAVAAIGSRGPDIQRLGKLGVMGRFRSTALPMAEFLSSSADTVEEVFFLCVKTQNS